MASLQKHMQQKDFNLISNPKKGFVLTCYSDMCVFYKQAEVRCCFPSLCVFRMLLYSPAQYRNTNHLKVPIPVRMKDSVMVAQHLPGLTHTASVPQWTLAKAHSCNKMPPALLEVTGKENPTACLHKGDNIEEAEYALPEVALCLYF